MPTHDAQDLHFIRHYVEMVVSMFAGMFVLGGAIVLALGLDTGSLYNDSPDWRSRAWRSR